MNGKKSNAPSPILLDVECDRHRAWLTKAACLKLGMYREDCQGCGRANHNGEPTKMVKTNSWSVKYAGFIQTREKWRKRRKVGE